MKTKLGPKLQALYKIVSQSYEVIWDTCCDHGNLGLAFIESNKAKKVNFVDQVPVIMEKLRKRLDLIPGFEKSRYELHTKAAQELKTGPQDLLCICGVGGEVVIEILKSLKPECDLLLSPQYHLFEVRRFLNDIGYKVLKEELVFEGKFGREIFYLSKDKGKSIDPIGAGLFDLSKKDHVDYLKGIISHLEKKADNPMALELYKGLSIL